MKVVILAGGFGTRLSEETHLRPKPMVEIGDKPIIWHIMKHYSSYGFNEFIIACGYKGYFIKEYFANYFIHQSDITFDLSKNGLHIHHSVSEPWKVTLIDTGLNTMTGGRIKRVSEYLDDTFMLTYGDGVSNVDLKALVQAHNISGKLCTVTSVQPSGRFGSLIINENNIVEEFVEKPKGDGAWINGGFFVCDKRVLNYIEDDQTIWERNPLEDLAKEHQLNAFHHHGFWKAMDTLRDKNDLDKYWNTNKAPWKTW